MLTAKQQQLLRYIKEHLDRGGVSPSFEEMKEALDLKSKSGIHRLISALEERGFIRRLANRARALEIVKLPEGMMPTAPAEAADPSTRAEKPAIPLRRPAAPPPARAMPTPANDVIEIPLHGRIAAGLPIEALEDRAMLAVPAALLGAGDHYALEVSGDSMADAGIFDGDFALIQRTEVARDGQIVVALIDETEATLKYLHHEGRRIRLDPANRDYQPQVYEANQVRIQGRLAGLLRRYN